MSIRNITEYKKDAVLRKKSNYVNKVNRGITDLIKDMADTMYMLTALVWLLLRSAYQRES